jgi:hypothetical protein
MSIVSGALLAAAGFTLLLWALAWFMPKFLGFLDSRWAHVLPAISVLFICASGLVRYLRKCGAGRPETHDGDESLTPP